MAMTILQLQSAAVMHACTCEALLPSIHTRKVAAAADVND